MTYLKYCPEMSYKINTVTSSESRLEDFYDPYCQPDKFQNPY